MLTDVSPPPAVAVPPDASRLTLTLGVIPDTSTETRTRLSGGGLDPARMMFPSRPGPRMTACATPVTVAVASPPSADAVPVAAVYVKLRVEPEPPAVAVPPDASTFAPDETVGVSPPTRAETVRCRSGGGTVEARTTLPVCPAAKTIGGGGWKMLAVASPPPAVAVPELAASVTVRVLAVPEAVAVPEDAVSASVSDAVPPPAVAVPVEAVYVNARLSVPPPAVAVPVAATSPSAARTVPPEAVAVPVAAVYVNERALSVPLAVAVPVSAVTFASGAAGSAPVAPLTQNGHRG
jgi:hypothetical protein